MSVRSRVEEPPSDGQASSTPGQPGDEEFGWPQPLWRTVERLKPPVRVLDARVWRSPLRGTWMTSVFAVVLLVGLPIVMVTGLLSYSAYSPQLGNAIPSDPGWLRLPYFQWPTSPSWLFRLNQGLHVILGLALIPVVLAKLWSVIPKLFAWPPARSIAQVLERVSIALLVGSILFQLITGVLNIQYDYVFGFDFYTGHYYGGWIFIVSFVVHVALKLPTMRKSLRSRSLREELKVPLAETRPEPPDEHGLAPVEPAEPTLSRRGLLGVVGGAVATVTALTAGQTVSDSLRRTALLAPRGQSYGDGPNDFQVNRTAESAGIVPDRTGGFWRLAVVGGSTPLMLSRDDLLAMPQHTAELPIACVEGWSTVQTWTGVRLRDLVQMAGLTEDDLQSGVVRSLEERGAFAQATLHPGQLTADDALLALKVNGADLSLDHGFPARVIVPALPGVLNTKWVREIELRRA